MCNLKNDHILKIFGINTRSWREKKNYVMFNKRIMSCSILLVFYVLF